MSTKHRPQWERYSRENLYWALRLAARHLVGHGQTGQALIDICRKDEAHAAALLLADMMEDVEREDAGWREQRAARELEAK